MKQRKNIAIIGATSAIAEHCARLWVDGKAADLTLVGRDARRLEAIAADLRIRSPDSIVSVREADFLNPASIQAVVEGITPQEPLDIVLIAHGSLPDQTHCQNDLADLRAAIEVNAISPVLFAEAFANRMAAAGYGSLVLIGSVAGDRGRKSNYVYGAAKGLVTRYAEGLQHRLASTGVSVTLVKPGPTDTPMTAHLNGGSVKLAPVADVARDIVKATERGQAVVYTPGKWRLIMLLVCLVPRFLFHKTNL